MYSSTFRFEIIIIVFRSTRKQWKTFYSKNITTNHSLTERDDEHHNNIITYRVRSYYFRSVVRIALISIATVLRALEQPHVLMQRSSGIVLPCLTARSPVVLDLWTTILQTIGDKKPPSPVMIVLPRSRRRLNPRQSYNIIIELFYVSRTHIITRCREVDLPVFGRGTSVLCVYISHSRLLNAFNLSSLPITVTVRTYIQ